MAVYKTSALLILAALLLLSRETGGASASGNSIVTADTGGAGTSLDLDGSGRPVVAYSKSGDLRLLRCGNALCTSGNTLMTVDSAGVVGDQPSLKLDALDRPVITYYDQTNSDVKFVRCGDQTCSAGNTFVSIDNPGGAAQDAALALDGSDRPLIIYRENPADVLQYTRCLDVLCASRNTITIDTGNIDAHTSIAFDATAGVYIAYRAAGDLMVAHCTDTTCGTNTTRDAGPGGVDASVAISAADLPMISHYYGDDLYLTRCGDAACDAAFLTPIDTTGNVGQFTSLALDASGKPVIAYFNLSKEDLKLVHCGVQTCASGNVLSTVDSVDGGAVGTFTSLVLNSMGNPVISYYDYNVTSDSVLKIAVCADPNCKMLTAAGVGGVTELSGVVSTQNEGRTGWIAVAIAAFCAFGIAFAAIGRQRRIRR